MGFLIQANLCWRQSLELQHEQPQHCRPKHSTAAWEQLWALPRALHTGHNRHSKCSLSTGDTHTPHPRIAQGKRQASCSRREDIIIHVEIAASSKKYRHCQDSVRCYISGSSDLAECYPRAERETQSHVTSAPSTMRVSMSTAVCTVIWRQPAMRAPFRGLDAEYISLIFISPGISFSAISMALRPQSARLMSAAREAGQVSEFE